jgi:hypothetical protein
MEDFNTMLINYFKSQTEDNHIEFRLAVNKTDEGFHLLIHPFGKDGETLDLRLCEHKSTWIHLGKK